MDKIEIVNVALGRIGVAAIESMNEASEAARIASRYYELTRKLVLRKFPWGFATRRVQLAQLEDVPEDFKYAYRYPADVLYLRGMYNEYFDKPIHDHYYKIISDKNGKVLLSNVPFASIEYTADITDATLFDSQFADAVSWKLAAEIAYVLTGNLNLAQYALQSYNAYMNEAMGNDAEEDNEEAADVVNRLADARFTGC